MKFKVSKHHLKFLLEQFEDAKPDFFAEIELEPVMETASEAMAYQSLQNEAWHKGYHYGFKEGYYTAKNERPFQILCDKKCPF